MANTPSFLRIAYVPLDTTVNPLPELARGTSLGSEEVIGGGDFELAHRVNNECHSLR